MNTIGQNIKLTFFGESHSQSIGIVMDNLPPGIELDLKLLEDELSKRRPKDPLSTSRIEPDAYEIVSGYHKGKTTGAPLTVLIKNQSVRSLDYDRMNSIPRPSHADYPAHIKYKGFNDPRGGGIFSGRMTALWMVIGSVAKQILMQHNISVVSHIYSLKDIQDTPFDKSDVNNEFQKLSDPGSFPVINSEIASKMTDLIETAKNNGDSVGGVIETAIIGLKAGVGEPLFGSLESWFSNLLFSIPGVKGVEFGSGFNITKMFGSEANDPYVVKDKTVKTLTNNNGGILGGISTGMPVIVRTAFKPTSSIFKKQASVDLDTMAEVDLEVVGRHDPCIVHRAVPVVNAVMYYAVLESLTSAHLNDWLKK